MNATILKSSLAVALALAAGFILAQAATTQAMPAGTIGTASTYGGRLANSSGGPVDGTGEFVDCSEEADIIGST